MILVTGATGNVGSEVVRSLLEAGEDVRAFVRDPEGARARLGSEVELAVGDLGDSGSIRRALGGVDRVFLSSADGPEKVAQETAVIDEAAAARVGLVVKCSTLLAEPGSPLPPFDWHGRIEDHLRSSRVPGVVLRSCFYMTNLLMAAEPVRATGKLVAPAGEGRIATVDPRDVAASAAAVLTTEGHAGRTYDLTGPAAISYAEIAAELSDATGEPIDYVDVPDDAARDALEAGGLPAWLVAHLTGLFALIRADALERTTSTVADLTGHAPRAFSEFARDHADLFRRHVLVG